MRTPGVPQSSENEIEDRTFDGENHSPNCQTDRDDVFRERESEDEDEEQAGGREIFRRGPNSQKGRLARENSSASKLENEPRLEFRQETEDEERKMELIRLIDKKLTRVRTKVLINIL